MAHASSTTALTRHRPRPGAALGVSSPGVQLVLAAGGIGLLLAIFEVALHPIWVGQPAGRPPPPTAAQAAQTIGWPGVVLCLVFVLGATLPFRPYSLAQRAAQHATELRLVLALTAGLGIVASLMYPVGSDVFDYAGFERMWVVYGDNPLLAIPANRPDDWASPLVWFADRTPAYGPLWALLTWPLVRLAGDSAALVVLGYKILSIGGYAACCWLIWSSVEPARRQRALVLFAWSPLVLFEVLGKVHNDILPTLALLALVWITTRRAAWHVLSLGTVAAGALVKITALAAAPPVLMYLWRRGGWRAVLPAALAALLLVVACYLPFWEGPRTLASIWNQTSRQIWSPASLLSIGAAAWLPGGTYDLLVRGLLALLCAAISVYLVLRTPLREPVQLAAISAWITLTAVLLLTGVVVGQYLVPAIALAAVSDDTRLQQLVFWLSLGALAAYNVDVLAITLGRNWLESDSYRVLGTLILLGPACAALLARGILRPRVI